MLERIEPYKEGEYKATPETANAKAEEMMTPMQRKMSEERAWRSGQLELRGLPGHLEYRFEDMSVQDSHEEKWPAYVKNVMRVSGEVKGHKIILRAGTDERNDPLNVASGASDSNFRGTVDGKELSDEAAKKLFYGYYADARQLGSNREREDMRAEIANQEVERGGEKMPTLGDVLAEERKSKKPDQDEEMLLLDLLRWQP